MKNDKKRIEIHPELRSELAIQPALGTGCSVYHIYKIGACKIGL